MPGEFDPYHKWLAIPPDEQPPNHYRLLAVPLYESDADVIDNAADARMVHVRSFQTGKHSAESQKLLNEITQAKLCLLNPQKKAAYDRRLRAELAASDAGPAVAEPLPAVKVAPVQHERRQQVQPWQVVATIALGVVLAAVISWVLLPGGGSDEVMVPEREGPVPEGVALGPPPPPSPPPPPQNPDGSETAVTPSPPPAPAKAPDGSGPSTPTPPEPPGTGEPEEPKGPEPANPVEAPSAEVPSGPTLLSGDALSQAAGQLETALAQAAGATDFQTAARKALRLVDQAILDGNRDLARALARSALRAARKADDIDLSREATLRVLDLRQPLSEPIQEEARKRLKR